MQFPASDAEKELVHESVGRLRKSLERAARDAAELKEVLSENYLAINSDYKKETFADVGKIEACAWQINVQLTRMNDRAERIIFRPEQNRC